MNSHELKINKSNLIGLTPEKKAILKSLCGAASIPVDFNEIRDEEKYGDKCKKTYSGGSDCSGSDPDASIAYDEGGQVKNNMDDSSCAREAVYNPPTKEYWDYFNAPEWIRHPNAKSFDGESSSLNKPKIAIFYDDSGNKIIIKPCESSCYIEDNLESILPDDVARIWDCSNMC